MAEAETPRILFAPASGHDVGGGHVMRDLALASALRARGAACAFAVTPYGRALVARFADAGVTTFERTSDLASVAEAAEAFGAHAVVLDDYGLDAAQIAPLRNRLPVVTVIDDLADRTYACDLLIDPGYGRRPADYAGRVPDGARLALGPDYALVRSDIADMSRAGAPHVAQTVRRMYLSFGLSDVMGIAARAVAVLRPLAPGVRIDVALSSEAESLPVLEAMARTDPDLHPHPDARDIAALMQGADLAVGAGGSSTWERCALGLPTLAVIVADNQREVIDRLAEAGVLLAVDMAEPAFKQRLGEAFAALLQPDLRRRLSQASRALCDGQGAARAAETILDLLR